MTAIISMPRPIPDPVMPVSTPAPVQMFMASSAMSGMTGQAKILSIVPEIRRPIPLDRSPLKERCHRTGCWERPLQTNWNWQPITGQKPSEFL